MSKIRIDFLKEKTDAECRELAGHYYRRARRAEKECDQLRTDFETLHSEREKLAEALELVLRIHDLSGSPEGEVTRLARAALDTYYNR